MSWGLRRQLLYLLGVMLFVAVVLFALSYPVLHQAPSCMDNKQNGDEQGIDCGGSCQRYCSFQVSAPVVLWSRAFHVVGGDYNLLAYVENSNKSGAVENATYEFRVYDTNGQLIGVRDGESFVPPNQRFPIFESRFDSGTATPANTTFAFTGNLIWMKKAPTIQTLPINVTKVTLGSDSTSPSLTAQISNNSIYDLPQFDVIAILYDKDSNAINVSKTHLAGLVSNASAPLSFTWPLAFSATPIKEDVLPQINPFLTNF